MSGTSFAVANDRLVFTYQLTARITPSFTNSANASDNTTAHVSSEKTAFLPAINAPDIPDK
jgi:hypothetical protein